jgi:Nucleotidyl transferase AbiEii toxin, Type IV TA system
VSGTRNPLAADPLPGWLAAVLPADTAQMWCRVRQVMPPGAYLIGGTAIAAHLRHRLSRDLDFCFETSVDLDAVVEQLGVFAPVRVTSRRDRGLDLLMSSTKVQLLCPVGHRRVEPTRLVEGLQVAGLGDLLAMKLQVVVDRPELRDYFDLLCMETRAHRYAEEGLALFVERFRPDVPDQAVATIIRYLADLSDVPDDPSLPLRRVEIERYWHRRVPEIVCNLER